MLLRVQFCSLSVVMDRMLQVTMRTMRMMGRFLMRPGVMFFGRFAMMLSGLFMMVGGLTMMVCCVF